MFALFEKRTKIFLYLLAWILYAVVHAVSMYYIVPVTVGLAVVDAFVHAGIFAGLGLLLRHVLRYGKYETLLPVQRFINYVALAILIISLWMGMGYLLDYILLQETAPLFIPTLPLRGMIGLLLYLIFIVSYSSETKQFLQQNADSDSNHAPPQTNTSTNVKHEIIDRITVKTGQKLHIIPLQEIIYLQAYGDYVQVITKDDIHLKEQTMKFFETHLPQNSFVRIHRSYIVNTGYIARIESYGKQYQEVALKNGQSLRMSISGYKLLKEALQL